MFETALLTIKVSDMERAVTFYGETLGLPRGPRYGEHWAEIHAPGIHIGLHPGATHEDSARNLSVGLRVADLDAAMSTLGARGITFGPRRTNASSRQAHFADPDGNPLYLIEVKG